MGHYEAGNSQCKIAEKVGFLDFAVNKMIVHFSIDGYKSSSPCTCRSETFDGTVSFVE